MNHRKMLNKSMDYIDEHLNEKITAEEIASAAGYSVYYFSRLFKQYLSLIHISEPTRPY